MIILYRESVKRAITEKRLKEGLCSPQRYQTFQLHLCFNRLTVTIQYGGHTHTHTHPQQTTHAVHEHLLPKPRQTREEARSLLCAPEAENGFGFILGKRRSPSQMRSCGMDTGRDNRHRYTQSCQISVANSTAKPALGSESWSL